MLQWQQVGVIVDVAQDALRVIREDPGRAKVVVRWVQTDDEVAREQIVAEHLVVAVGIDEDVRERSGRVADVATPIEEPEKLPDLAIDLGNLVLPMPDVLSRRCPPRRRSEASALGSSRFRVARCARSATQ